ncbi:MAG: FitA-like ribbon-helix-helix domain-containing protein [Methylococcales bacterium]
MPVTLSIKNVPDKVAQKLRERASANHRSIQGELVAILEDSLQKKKAMTALDLLQNVRQLGLKTPAEARVILRAERNAR